MKISSKEPGSQDTGTVEAYAEIGISRRAVFSDLRKAARYHLVEEALRPAEMLLDLYDRHALKLVRQDRAAAERLSSATSTPLARLFEAGVLETSSLGRFVARANAVDAPVLGKDIAFFEPVDFQYLAMSHGIGPAALRETLVWQHLVTESGRFAFATAPEDRLARLGLGPIRAGGETGRLVEPARATRVASMGLK